MLATNNSILMSQYSDSIVFEIDIPKKICKIALLVKYHEIIILAVNLNSKGEIDEIRK